MGPAMSTPTKHSPPPGPAGLAVQSGRRACSHATLIFPNDINYSDVHARALTYLEAS